MGRNRVTRRSATGFALAIAFVAVTWASMGPAVAAFPGANGRVAFTYNASGPMTTTEVATVGADGQGLDLLTDSPAEDYEPSYSADGERIVFVRQPGTFETSEIWVMNSDGGGETQLTNGGGAGYDLNPGFSPDGRKIAFDRTDGGTSQVWVMNADGSGQTPLTTVSESSHNPAFSPDGGTIAFQRGPDVGPFGIWAMDADGSNQRPLTTGPTDVAASFSPDGSRIAFARTVGGYFDIWLMNTDGSGQTPVTTRAGEDEISPAFSPDGTRIAYEDRAGADSLRLVDPTGQNDGPFASDPTADFEEPDWQALNAPVGDVSGEQQKSLKRVSVTATSANEDATVTVAGSGKAPKAPKGAVASKAKRFAIPPVSAEIPAATPTEVTLPIPKKGRKVLKRAAKAGKKGKATIDATFTDDLGQSSSDGLKLRFKPKMR